ncbi:hypothetical protein AX16_006184 [Volvariella volvacea WC 439]|nr:hypothetical protein AX16_006184 [Volvariella volvacea WC 439]
MPHIQDDPSSFYAPNGRNVAKSSSAIPSNPNRHGHGHSQSQSYSRSHPRAPPTAPPLDDDFDAYTLAATTVVGGPGGMGVREWKPVHSQRSRTGMHQSSRSVDYHSASSHQQHQSQQHQQGPLSHQPVAHSTPTGSRYYHQSYPPQSASPAPPADHHQRHRSYTPQPQSQAQVQTQVQRRSSQRDRERDQTRDRDYSRDPELGRDRERSRAPAVHSYGPQYPATNIQPNSNSSSSRRQHPPTSNNVLTGIRMDHEQDRYRDSAEVVRMEMGMNGNSDIVDESMISAGSELNGLPPVAPTPAPQPPPQAQPQPQNRSGQLVASRGPQSSRQNLRSQAQGQSQAPVPAQTQVVTYGNGGNNGYLGAIDEMGPRAGQDYEMIDRRVVEETPERTVTISTWREQVAREMQDAMSVYYVTPGDYAAEASGGSHGRSLSYGHSRNQSHNSQNHGRDTPVVRQLSGRDSSKRAGSEGNTSGHRAIAVATVNGSHVLTTVQEPRTMTPPQNAPASSSSPGGDNSSNLQARYGRKSPYIWKRESPVQPAATPIVDVSIELTESINPDELINDSPPRTSTPVRGGPSPSTRMATPPDQGSTSNRSQSHSNSNSRSRSHQSRPASPAPSSPFHPTRSGSIIDTISGEGSETTFERIFSSCEPSLTHIIPILASLGVTNEAHLKAVARLTEETRNRHVREEALKRGMTIVEWAIFLDMLKSL